jgi:tRNA-(ms[2]io[6]A)-hydroxylase
MDRVLIDHAHCEKKAAAHALSIMSRYADETGVARAMAVLAREEAGHLAEVLGILERRKLSLGRDPGDPYAQALFKRAHSSGPLRQVDLLLASGLIELRSEERLSLLATHLDDPELAAFYQRLCLSEAGHAALFFSLAERRAGSRYAERERAWFDAEAELIATLPVRPAIH